MLPLKRLLAAFLLSCLAGPAQAAESAVSADLLAAINSFRANEGLQPLSRNPELDAASQGHSDYMVRANFVGHIGPDGRDLPLRIEDTGYSYRVLAENIAAGPNDPDAALAAWLDSPPHAHNLRLAEVKDIGLGYSSGEIVLEEGVARDVWTVILAAPAQLQSEAPGASTPQVVLVLQPAYHAQSNLQPRGRAQGTP